MNLVCSICSEIYEPSDDVNITACGHMFHRACLLPWLERSASCPQCRSKCTEATLKKIFLNTTTNQTSNRITHRTGEHSLQHQVDELKIKTREQENSLKRLEKTVLNIRAIQCQHDKMREDYEEMKQLKEDMEHIIWQSRVERLRTKPPSKSTKRTDFDDFSDNVGHFSDNGGQDFY